MCGPALLRRNVELSSHTIILFQVVYKRVEEDKAIVLMCTNVDEVTERISTSAKDCSVLVPKER